ncbi:carboxylating nicotinate-nucleotide diphosphorylase [Halonatronum saccharophilum]|uniref:carboxylating nicotinate-nucleotide diphosphorylase n=1 Tax=Halonatronum saccharophilum TaxID=150060 RepID=UPI0004805FF4|nr:carboxylating nicotinate-nucleotide diphosphorylase [Halonatronum saccharophilum]
MNLNKRKILEVIEGALKEDIGWGDITTQTLIDPAQRGEGSILVKEDGVVGGLDVARWVFESVDESIEFIALVEEGVKVEAGTVIAKIKGSTASILTGERVALNFLQRISGIATKANRYQSLVEEYGVKIVDTRKTTPGLRILEKYGVALGGAYNHRFSLCDAVMIKDNHIKAIGSIKEAINLARKRVSHTTKIEVEVESLEEVKEALEARADIIMLDNMSPKKMEKAVGLIGDSAIIEASGGIERKDLVQVAKTGVDIISLGTLTHTINSLDISLNLL